MGRNLEGLEVRAGGEGLLGEYGGDPEVLLANRKVGSGTYLL